MNIKLNQIKSIHLVAAIIARKKIVHCLTTNAKNIRNRMEESNLTKHLLIRFLQSSESLILS